MEMMEQIPRTLEVMIEAMDGRSMDRLVAAWDEWDAPTVQRPAIHRWLRNLNIFGVPILIVVSAVGLWSFRRTRRS